jgi:hypothetical protein
MTEKLRATGKLGDARGPMFDSKKVDKLASFALPHGQSKRIFKEGTLPDLFEVTDLACGGEVEDAEMMKRFMEKHVRTLRLLSLNREHKDGEIDRLGTPPSPPPPPSCASLTPPPPPCKSNAERRNISMLGHHEFGRCTSRHELLPRARSGTCHLAVTRVRQPMAMQE